MEEEKLTSANEDLLSGLVVRAQSGFFVVETHQGLITAKIRGRLLKGQREANAVALGDRVQLKLLPDGKGSIQRVDERSCVLRRKAPGSEREQVIVANLDQAVFVFSYAEPAPHIRMLDRLLVVAESESIPAIICANKVDLTKNRSERKFFSHYESLGYPVIQTSALKGKGIRELEKSLKGKISVFAGPSGVGKSSLLNAIQPDLALRTSEISATTSKGTHTTVAPKLVALEQGGYVADTPGLKAFALWDIEPEEIDAYFVEIAPLVANCSFSNCTHLQEPGCAVIAAVEAGEIDPARYDSYCRLRLDEEANV